MFHSIWRPVEGGGDGVGTPYDGLYGEAPPERGTYVFQASGIKRVGKSVIWVCEKAQKG